MKNFLLRALLFLTPCFLFILFLNCNIDTYGVIMGRMKKPRHEPNQRYLKTLHLIKNPSKYNSIIFGSSRAGKLDTRNIVDSNNWYNMSYSVGLPPEHLHDLELLIRKKVNIKKVVIALDEISYHSNPKPHESDPLRRPYINRINPLYKYVFKIPDPTRIFKKDVIDTNGFYTIFDIYNSGVPIGYKIDNYINSNREQHINNSKFQNPTWGYDYTPRVKETIKNIKTILHLCENSGIELILFINPVHITTFLKQDLNIYYQFLSELSELTNFYDFSGINEVTTNNFNYYETSHFRPFIGDSILNYIVHSNKEPNSNFGQLITKSNIDSVIARKKIEYNQYMNASVKNANSAF